MVFVRGGARSPWRARVWQDPKGAANQQKKLVRQMYNYAAIYSDDTQPFQKPRRCWTGKAMGEQVFPAAFSCSFSFQPAFCR